MEVEHTNLNSHPEDGHQVGDNERGNWHRRLRLRKSSTATHTVKNMTEEERLVTEPPKNPSQNELQDQQVVNISSSKLTFTCSICKDSTLFSPNGLLQHFDVFHGGKGDPPTFPCDMCSFATPDFTALQQHRMTHKQCKLTCEICNDNVLQTLSQIKKHCKTQHSMNGEYHCEKCRFSTKELNIFVYHSCPNSDDSSIDSTVIKPKNVERNSSHDTAGDGTAQKDEIQKHMATDCSQSWRRKNWWKNREVPAKCLSINTSKFKILLPKPEKQWKSSEFLPFSAASLLDGNGIFLNPARTLEETQQFLERTVNSGKQWPVTLKGEPELASLSCTGPVPLQPKIKQYSIPIPGLKDSWQNKLSGLMEKNNISVPPDCTTKVVGFKMVDGKKHLILKVIPSAKPEVTPDTGEANPSLTPVECKDAESGSQIERLSDGTCRKRCNMTSKMSPFPFCNATSGSGQPEKKKEKQPEDPVEDALQVDNTENNCSNDTWALIEASIASPQFTVSGKEEIFNVANQRNTGKQVMLPDFNNTHHLNGVAAEVPVELSPIREVDIQTLHANIQETEHTKEHTESQEIAAEALKEKCPKLTTSPNDSGCHGDLASSSPSDLDFLEESFKSQLSAQMSEEERSSNVDMNKMDAKSRETVPVIQRHLNEQKMGEMLSSALLCSTANQEKEAIFEPNVVKPTFVSLHRPTTEPSFNSPSEGGGLLFQGNDDEYTNNVDPGDPPVPLEQSCTPETVEEPNYMAILPLGDTCHDPELCQTLGELPVTTITHLLDEPEITTRAITNQPGDPGCLSAQVNLLSRIAIPVAAPATEKDSSQSNVCLSPEYEPAMKKKRQVEPTKEVPHVPISKARKQLVQTFQENDPPASVLYWEPAPQAVERTLRLLPVCSSQPIKVPHLNQPVIVLNHPDTDIPEVANIMRVVNKHKGAVQKVVLSQGTLKALSELSCESFRKSLGANCHSSHCRRAWPQETVKERFILKLKLKRLSGNKFKVTPSASKTNRYQSTFRCWFCGRLFRNQEAWVGHGQRHLMEATRDWNKLFNSERHHNNMASTEPYFR
ncbi:uncharacterized protein [Hoplias malabaricus]|uniref:uncharacterized protein n=1 Tax=Hoplias malabaricus TaxID=27720 RepID=UPI003462CA35